MNETPNSDSSKDGDPQPWGGSAAKKSSGGMRVGFSSMALLLLISAMSVAGLTLWGAPKLVPYLPAPLAEVLARGAYQDEIDGLSARLEDLEGLQGRIATLEDFDGRALADRVAKAHRRAEGNRVEIEVIESRVSSTEQVARDALEGTLRQANRIDTLRADLTALRTVIGDLREREDEFSSASTELQGDISGFRETGGSSLTTVRATLKELEIRAVATELRVLLEQGHPYALALERLEELSGILAPDALANPSAIGLTAMPVLRETFPAAARAALATGRTPVNDEDPVHSRILAWFGSQISVRPTQPVSGTSVGAVLSRIEAAIKADDAQRALAEAESLNEEASSAMAGWLLQLAAKVDAEATLASYLAAATGDS